MPDLQALDYNSVFAINLNKLLADHDLSQAALAERLGVSAQSVSNWCNGKKAPRMDKVDRICQLYGLRREDLTTDHSIHREEPPTVDGEELTPDEIQLIKRFRASSDLQKAAALAAAKAILDANL